MANVQIPEDLFVDLCLLVEQYNKYQDIDDDLFRRCANGLNAKCSTIMARRAYSRYHDADAPAADREQARQEYLMLRGIPDSFRWPEGGSTQPPPVKVKNPNVDA